MVYLLSENWLFIVLEWSICCPCFTTIHPLSENCVSAVWEWSICCPRMVYPLSENGLSAVWEWSIHCLRMNYSLTLWQWSLHWLRMVCPRSENEFDSLAVGEWSMLCLKPVLNWANVCSPEHTPDTSTNYDSFLNWTFSSPNMVRTVQTLLHSQLSCNEMQASARTCGRRAADSMIVNVR